MLQLYDSSRNKIAGLQNYRDLRVERDLSGDEVLSFSIPQVDNNYEDIKEECYIRTKSNEYVIKGINIQDDWTEFVAKVNVEDVKGTPFSNFETIEQTCTDTVNLALVGTGWSIGSCNVTKRRTVRKANCSSYDILQEIRKVYMCDYLFDAKSKKVYIYQTRGSDKGVYFLDELNLKTLSVQSNSYDYCTRIIPVGKDGLKITSINGGKDYVENYQYSNKIITIYWEDNRYSVAASLKEDAEYKLNELSKPIRSYNADVYDLANLNIMKYKSVLDYDLGDTITLLSKDKKVRDKQRIVKLIEYPDEPERNSCEIANRTITFEDMQLDTLRAVETVNTVTTSDNKIDTSKVDFDPIRLEVETLVAERAYISDLNAAVARIGTLEVTSATITQLNATNANIDNLQATKADIDDLTASNARITTLEAETADINTLLAGNIGAANIAAGAITAGSSIIAQGAIGSAQISDLSASKIAAGTIDTAVVTISGANGRLKITGNRMQVFAGTTSLYERVSIGDVNGDGTVYGFRVRGADGTTVLLDETGVKREGITDGSINNVKIAGDANISGTKLDIASVVTSINNGTTTIQGSKVFLNNSTLDVQFNSLSTTVSNIQVGGRNLVTKNSETIDSGTVVNSNDGYTFNLSVSNVNQGLKVPQLLTVGQQYTLSYLVKYVSGTMQNFGGNQRHTQNALYIDGVSSASSYHNGFTIPTDGVYHKVVLVITAINNTEGIGIESNRYTSGLTGTWQVTNIQLEKGNKATDWTPAPEDIQGQIDTQQTTITSQGSQITANTNAISLKVDTTTYNTKMTSLDGSITSINTTLTSQSSSISVLQGQIVTKVTQTDINNSINGISIGGRNLYKKTLTTVLNGGTYTLDYAAGFDSGNKAIRLTMSATPNLIRINNVIPRNSMYTLSFYVKSNNASSYSGSVDVCDGSIIGGSANFTATTSWTYVKMEYFNVTNWSSGTYHFVDFNLPANADILISHLMVVEGNKAVTWAPAPEDVQGQIDSAVTRITSAESSITQLNNSITLKVNTSDFGTYQTNNDAAVNSKASQTDLNTTNTNVTNVTTRMTTAESSISVLQGQIVTKVTQTDITNSINTIQVGGRNLLRKTGMLNGEHNLGANVGTGVTTTITVIDETTAPHGKAVTITRTDNTTTSGGRYWACSLLTTGQVYSWSVWLKGSGSWTVGQEQSGSKTVTLTGTWTKYTNTFTATSGSYYQFIFYTTTLNGTISIHSLKLEQGNKVTDYSEAPEDIQSQLDTHESRISTAETKITPTAIVSTVRTSTEYTTDQGLKVNKATVISEINQSAEAIKIQAGMIDINGAVTFNSLDDAMKQSLNQGLLSTNPAFANWTSTYPSGYSSWGTGAITKEGTLTRNGGFSARFNVASLGTQMGIGMYPTAYVSNVNNNKYLFLEIDFMLVSGSLSGSCVLVDWTGMGTYRSQTNLATEIPSPTLNKWYSIRKVIQRPSDTTTGWTGMAGYVLANWSGSGDAVKDIVFDRVAIREATQQEIDLFTNKSGWDTIETTVNNNSTNWTDAKSKVDLWKHPTDATKIDGGEIYANSITTDKLIVADTHNYVAWNQKGTATSSPWDSRATVDSSTYYNAVASFKIPANTTLLGAKNVIPVKAGDVFYVEFMFKTDSSFNGTNSLTKLRFGNQTGALIYALTPTIAVNTSWVKYTGEFTVPSGTTWLIPSIGYDGTAGNVWYDDIVIAKQNGGELLVDGTISTDKVTSNFGTSLNISSNTSITSLVSNKADTSYVDQTATDVTFSFTSSSGQNLLLNSTGYGGTSNWYTNSTMYGAYNDGAYAVCKRSEGYCLYVMNSATTERGAWSQQFVLKPSTKYTISGWYYVGSGSTGMDTYFMTKNTAYTGNGYNAGYDTATLLKTDNQAGTGVWKTFSVTVTTGSSVKSGHIRLDNNGSVDAISHGCYWGELMVTEGELTKAWTPNQNEIYAGTTIIDRNGLTITDGQLNVVSQGRNIFKVQDGYHYNEWGMACRVASGSWQIGSGTKYFNNLDACLYRPFGLYHESTNTTPLKLQILTNTARTEFMDLNASGWRGVAAGTGEFDSFVYSNSYVSGANIINRSLRDIKTDVTRYDDSMAYDGIKGVNIYNFNMGCNDADGNPITSLNLGIMVDEAPIEITQLGGGEGADRQGINLYSYASYLASALKTAINKIEALEYEVELLKGGAA